MNIYFFYTGGLKREVYIINNLKKKFDKIYLFTIDSKINNLEEKKNLYIKKSILLKIFIYLINYLSKLKVNKHFINFISFNFIDLFFCLKLLFIRPNQKDIAVCENNICFFLLKLCKFKKLNSILDVSNIHILEKQKYLSDLSLKSNLFDTLILKRGLGEYKSADKITILSTNVLNSFRIHNPNLIHKCILTFSGVDVSLFYPKKVDIKYSICIVGAISKYKNSHVLFNLIDSIKISDLKIVIVGNFDSTMNEISINNHSYTHIKELNQSDLSKIYSSSKIICISSYIEGMPKVIMEALACGIPAIGFKGSSIEDIIINDYNGYVIENDNLSDFKDKIELTLKNKKIYSRLQKNCRKYISSKFNLKEYSLNWNEIFR